MRLVVLLPPPREAAPCTPGDEALHLGRGFAVARGTEAAKVKFWGLRVALRGLGIAERGERPPALLCCPRCPGFPSGP